jgi:HSP20 family molecular chaperone IbpA
MSKRTRKIKVEESTPGFKQGTHVEVTVEPGKLTIESRP